MSDGNQTLQQYESIIRFSNDAIIGLTLQGAIVSWNPAAELISGYLATEVKGELILRFLPPDHSGEVAALFTRLRQGEVIVSYETVFVGKGGRATDVSLTASPIKDARSEVSGASLIMRDITERKRAEERLEQQRFLVDTMMENIPDHIYFKDRQSRFIRINPAMAAQFRLKDPAEAIGKSDFDFFTTEHAQRAFEDEQEILRHGQPMVNREEKETWPDGSITWVSTTKQCLRDKSGQAIGTFGISRDITTQKIAEEALAEKAKELARSNQELEQFAYAASHDLQEPLRMIASYTQLLGRRYKDKLDADGHEFIAFAVDGAKRMQVLINDLLAYSRVGTRGKPFAPTDMTEIMQRVLANLAIAIAERQAQIRTEGLPVVVADATQMTQLLQNLVANAIKFCPAERQVDVVVHAESKRQDGTAEWVFSVRDNGIGIDPQHFERIFVIFQRLHSREEYPGTGIGLALCKKIVERHRGRIWVESSPGQGTTFYFSLPERAESPGHE